MNYTIEIKDQLSHLPYGYLKTEFGIIPLSENYIAPEGRVVISESDDDYDQFSQILASSKMNVSLEYSSVVSERFYNSFGSPPFIANDGQRQMKVDQLRFAKNIKPCMVVIKVTGTMSNTDHPCRYGSWFYDQATGTQNFYAKESCYLNGYFISQIPRALNATSFGASVVTDCTWYNGDMHPADLEEMKKLKRTDGCKEYVLLGQNPELYIRGNVTDFEALP